MKTKFTNYLMMFLFIIGSILQTKASSGETELIYVGGGKYMTTRVLWANTSGHAANLCDPNFLETPSGAVFSLDDGWIPESASSLILNGFFVTLSTFNNAVAIGNRFILHSERQWCQMMTQNTSNFFDEGIITGLDLVNNTVTIKYYDNLPAGCVFFNDSLFNYNPSAYMKYENVVGSESEVLAIGRHLRIYKPRPQTVYAFTQAALNDVREPRGGALLGWTRQGFYHGQVTNGDVYFAEKRNGEWVNTYTSVPKTEYIATMDGYRFTPEGRYSVSRQGDRLIAAPRMTSTTSNYGSDYGQIIAADEESVIGKIVAINGNIVSVEMDFCPTGRAASAYTTIINVTLAADAEYCLNGIKGSLKTDAIKVGNSVRILKAAANGMLLVRDAGTAGQSKMEITSAPTITAAMPTNYPRMELTIEGKPWVQNDTLFQKENEIATLEVWVFTNTNTQIEWFRNGIAIPGTKSVISDKGFVSIKEYTNLSDDGAKFECKATTSGGTTTSSPIILKVSPDTSPLTVKGIAIGDKNTIQLTFNKAVQVGTTTHGAERIANYSINNGITINSITLIGDLSTVIIKTSNLTSGNDYTVTINNVQDISETPIVIAPNTKSTVSYSIKFRYLRFVSKGKGSLSPRVVEMRYIENGISYGTSKTYYGLADSYKAFDNNGGTYCQINTAEIIGLDMAIGSEILPDSLMINVSSSSNRNINGFKIEGSNDFTNWILLLENNTTLLGSATTPYYFPIDNSGLNADSVLIGAKSAQTITFPVISNKDISTSPVTLNATASSSLPVTYYLMGGPAEISGNQVILKDTGTVWIRATQAGNNSFYSAYPKDQKFKVTGIITNIINPNTKESILIAYPNPTNGIINIQISGTNNVQLINGIGNVIKNIVIENIASIDISELPQGLYLIKSNNEIVKIIKK